MARYQPCLQLFTCQASMPSNISCGGTCLVCMSTWVLCKCSFRGDLAARLRWAGRTLSWALDMANFENVPVQLTGFEMENSTMLWSVFISEVGQNIKAHEQHLTFCVGFLLSKTGQQVCCYGQSLLHSSCKQLNYQVSGWGCCAVQVVHKGFAVVDPMGYAPARLLRHNTVHA